MRKGPGGFPGGMGGMDLSRMMKQAQKMQEDLAKAQESLLEQTVEGTAGGGAVTVTANGHREITAVRIKPEAVDPDDIETLEDLVLAATRDAQAKAAALAQERLGSIAGGMGGLPGLM
ncbi:MAG: YbaB/EbfC family nucleoid-associated protein [Candidatus Sericytochromatia bacterium]|nr:YbaB/EbfC family nucleoid-associated protein [Candidatus Tanganyikabacteria bacterium]